MIKIYSKIELSENIKRKIYQFLHFKYPQKNLLISQLEFLIDEKIISGVKIDIESEIIDLTFNARIEKLVSKLNESTN
jgi:F0F1-type ATP synthase delta subunit